MAEEITNNPAPLTARQVAAENPELNKLREIAFGTNYLDDIDAGTGTARFYSGFGQQPNYTGTNTDQAIADAVTAQAETVAAPDQSSGNGQETSGGGLEESGTFGGNPTYSSDGSTVDTDGNIINPDGTPGGNIVDEFGQDGNVYASSFDPTTGDVTNVDGTYSGNIVDEFSETPESFAAQQGIDYRGLDQEGQREIDEQFKTTPQIDPAINFNPLRTAANIITGGITDIPFVGTAVEKAVNFFKGSEDDSVASTTTPTMGDTGVDAFENDPNNIQTPLETATGINQIDLTEAPPEIGLDSEFIDQVAEDQKLNDPYADIDAFYEGDDVGIAGAPGSAMDAAFGPGKNLSNTPAPDPAIANAALNSSFYVDDSSSNTNTSSPNATNNSYASEEAAIASNTPSQPDQRDRGGDGGGGGGGGKIVCTMMNDTYGFGNFRNKIWLRQSKDLAPEYQKGYHKIFLPLVRLSKTNVVIRKVLEHIAVHRTIDIRQEARGKVHILGRVYRKVLEPICYLVGKYVK